MSSVHYMSSLSNGNQLTHDNIFLLTHCVCNIDTKKCVHIFKTEVLVRSTIVVKGGTVFYVS